MTEQLDMHEEYEFTITDRTHPNRRCCSSIIAWIKSNLEGLTDDNSHQIFSKVNYGYNSETIKGFGKRPVADVYIDTVTYDSDLMDNKPNTVNSFIICYFKGNMNNAYEKACELADYLVQEFEENDDFRELTGYVRYTYVRNVKLQIIPAGKAYGVLCAFELEHNLF